MKEDQPRVECLHTVCELHHLCDSESLKISKDSNEFMLRVTLKKLGSSLSQKLAKILEKDGLLEWKKDDGYEVESILDHVVEDGKEMYLVKWKGWQHKYNTWEPKEHLNCDFILKQYHQEQQCQQRKRKRLSSGPDTSYQPKQRCIDDVIDSIIKIPDMTPMKLLSHLSYDEIKRIPGLIRNGQSVALKKPRNIYNRRTKSYKQLRLEVQLALKEWEKQINKLSKDLAPIRIENNVDLEGPPMTFTYINDYMPMPGIVIPDDPVIGCSCGDCIAEKKSCCGHNMGSEFAYYKNKRVRVPPGTPIYECNKLCKCGPECSNRVVQHGRKLPVCLFRTDNGRGWGVKALHKVKKGSFVMEYVGEVITNEEAERRGKIYDAEGRTYLFDLDYNDTDCPYTVDAGLYGNVSHFVNHSCDPNLAVYGVWINHLNPQLPRIALFAMRDIEKGEEFTFDYMMTGDTTQMAMEDLKEGESSTENTLTCNSGALLSDSMELIDANATSLLNGSLTNGSITGLSEDSSGISSSSDPSIDPFPAAPDKFGGFMKQKTVSPSPAAKYRIRCQCGAANCRKYLF